MICITIVPNIRQFLGKDLDYIIDSVLDHNIEIPNYNPLSGSICIKLSKELNHPNKVSLIFKVSMIMNALNGVYSDTYILQIIIQQELGRLANYLETN